MQAIVTRYISPSNTRGTRIKATASAGSIVMGYKYALGIEGNHEAACQLLREKFGWIGAAYGTHHGGQVANGDYVWVMVPDVAPSTRRDLSHKQF